MNNGPLPQENQPEKHEKRFDGIVRSPRQSDIAALKPILEQWLRDRDNGALLPEEIAKVLGRVESSANGSLSGPHYLVAEAADGQVVGLMGMIKPDKDMKQFAVTSDPIELVNAYVDQERRGQGVGSALADNLEQLARDADYTSIVVNSGPRYQDTGWDFWTKRYGEPVAIQRDLYGPGGDAPIWAVAL